MLHAREFSGTTPLSTTRFPVAMMAADRSKEVQPTGRSAPMRAVQRIIQQVAGYSSNVLILGESGTGKEVAARAIHAASPRRERAFIAVNCGAIPADLLESELFGHEKGSFTGALATRKGRFELAEGGTIFLDEVGDMNPAMQVKLLRVLQERCFERVGSCTTQACDVRVIAATHRNLEELIAQGKFREDLFYRLNVVPIEMPALRERGADLPELVDVLNQRVRAQYGQSVMFTPEAMAALQVYRWPGNVRELSNLIERMCVQCQQDVVDVGDLPARYRPSDWRAGDREVTMAEQDASSSTGSSSTGIAFAPQSVQAVVSMYESQVEQPLAAESVDRVLQGVPSEELVLLPESGIDMRQYLENLEQRLIHRALHAAGGTVAQAARLLGLRRTTLIEKLRKYGIVAQDTVARSGSV